MRPWWYMKPPLADAAATTLYTKSRQGGPWRHRQILIPCLFKNWTSQNSPTLASFLSPLQLIFFDGTKSSKKFIHFSISYRKGITVGQWQVGAFRRQTRSYVCSKNVRLVSHVNQMGDREKMDFRRFLCQYLMDFNNSNVKIIPQAGPFGN